MLRPSRQSDKKVDFLESPEGLKSNYGTFDGGYEPVNHTKKASPTDALNFSSYKHTLDYKELHDQLLSS